METCSGFSEAEIGRLVCGYLTSLGCKSTIEKFLQESKAELKIREFAALVDQGILKNFDVDGLNLVDVLYEYSQMKSTLDNLIKNEFKADEVIMYKSDGPLRKLKILSDHWISKSGENSSEKCRKLKLHHSYIAASSSASKGPKTFNKYQNFTNQRARTLRLNEANKKPYVIPEKTPQMSPELPQEIPSISPEIPQQIPNEIPKEILPRQTKEVSKDTPEEQIHQERNSPTKSRKSQLKSKVPMRNSFKNDFRKALESNDEEGLKTIGEPIANAINSVDKSVENFMANSELMENLLNLLDEVTEATEIKVVNNAKQDHDEIKEPASNCSSRLAIDEIMDFQIEPDPIESEPEVAQGVAISQVVAEMNQEFDAERRKSLSATPERVETPLSTPQKLPEIPSEVIEKPSKTTENSSEVLSKSFFSPEKTLKPPEILFEFKPPEKPVRTPRKSLTTPEKLSKTTEKRLKTPEKVLKTTKTLDKSKEMSQNSLTPPKILKSPEKSLEPPERLLKTPTKSQKTPEKVLLTPGKLLKTPEKSIQTPEKPLKTPKAARKTPEKLPENPGKFSKTPEKSTEKPLETLDKPFSLRRSSRPRKAKISFGERGHKKAKKPTNILSKLIPTVDSLVHSDARNLQLVNPIVNSEKSSTSVGCYMKMIASQGFVTSTDIEEAENSGVDLDQFIIEEELLEKLENVDILHQVVQETFSSPVRETSETLKSPIQETLENSVTLKSPIQEILKSPLLETLKSPTLDALKSPYKFKTPLKRLKKSPIPSPFLASPGTPCKNISIASISFNENENLMFTPSVQDQDQDQDLKTPSPCSNPEEPLVTPPLESSDKTGHLAPRTPRGKFMDDFVMSSPLKMLKNLCESQKKTFVFLSPSKRLPKRANLVPVSTQSPLRAFSKWEACHDVNNLDHYQTKVKTCENKTSKKRKLSSGGASKQKKAKIDINMELVPQLTTTPPRGGTAKTQAGSSQKKSNNVPSALGLVKTPVKRGKGRKTVQRNLLDEDGFLSPQKEARKTIPAPSPAKSVSCKLKASLLSFSQSFTFYEQKPWDQ